MKTLKVFIISFIVVLILTGCKVTEDKISESRVPETEQTSNSTNNDIEEQLTKKGFKMGDYSFFLLNSQKESEKEKQMFINNIEQGILPEFNKVETKIDKNKKVNIIPYGFQYSMEEETVEIGVFLINTFPEGIKEIAFKGGPVFKNFDFDKSLKITYTKDEFLNLPPRGVVMLNLRYLAPYEEYFDLLNENKTTDLSFEIEELEINGEKVENVN